MTNIIDPNLSFRGDLDFLAESDLLAVGRANGRNDTLVSAFFNFHMIDPDEDLF